MARRSGLCLVLALAALGAGASARASADGPVALVVNTDDPAFSWARVQRAVTDAVGGPVVATDDPTASGRRGLLTVAWRPSRHELAVTYEDVRGTISRVVAAPNDVAAGVAAAAALAANLTRDQAAELLGADAAAPAEPPPAAPAQPPAPLRIVDVEGAVTSANAPAPPPKPLPRRWSFALSIGSSVGWASGNGEVQNTPVRSGLVQAPLGHVAPEVGYFLGPRLMLSIGARLQRVTGANDLHVTDAQSCGPDLVCTTPRSAVAAFARAALFSAPSERDLRFYFSFALGAGDIRYPMAMPAVRMCGDKGVSTCVDTVNTGPFFTGPGGGLRWRVAGPVDLAARLELLFTSQLTFNVDLNAGVAVSL